MLINLPVFRLLDLKALYGLKQAPRAWNKRINTFLRQKGFKRSSADPQLYIYRKGDTITMISLYVDDLVLTGNDEGHITWTKSVLTGEFEMTDLGLLHFFLGQEIWQTEGGMFISQQRYVHELLETLVCSSANPFLFPWILTRSCPNMIPLLL